MEAFMTDFMLPVTYVLFFATVLLAVVMPFVKVANPAAMKRSFLGFGVLVVLFFISYLMSGSEAPNPNVAKIYEKFGITEGMSKFVGAPLIMFYWMAFLVLVGIVYLEIRKLLKL